MSLHAYHLGCPVWSHRPWVGTLYREGSQPEDFLRQYASVFNAVEGNATFYGLPRPATVTRWAEETPESFRFCFKFPQEVTHQGRLADKLPAASAFLDLMRPLGPRLGPFMLQLPAAFDPDELEQLDSFLGRLPADLPYAVELRHPAFFSGGTAEAALDASLRRHAVDRVIFDSRGLWSSDPSDPAVRAAQARKPRLPVRLTVTGRSPLVRFVAHAEDSANRWLLRSWAEQIAAWIGEGLAPFVFVHTPDEVHAPALARRLHHLVAARTEVGEMPPWPTEVPGPVRQLGLFS